MCACGAGGGEGRVFNRTFAQPSVSFSSDEETVDQFLRDIFLALSYLYRLLFPFNNARQWPTYDRIYETTEAESCLGHRQGSQAAGNPLRIPPRLSPLMEVAPTVEAHLPPGVTPGLLAICMRGPCRARGPFPLYFPRD